MGDLYPAVYPPVLRERGGGREIPPVLLFSWEREMFSPEEKTLDLYVAPLRAADCIDYAKVIMGTLGHKVFEPLNSVS